MLFRDWTIKSRMGELLDVRKSQEPARSRSPSQTNNPRGIQFEQLRGIRRDVRRSDSSLEHQLRHNIITERVELIEAEIK